MIPSVNTSGCVIINPTAGRGRGEALLPRVRSAFTAHGMKVLVTGKQGDEERLVTEATGRAEVIVAVGGDGTCARIADAIIRSKAKCRLAVVPCGTGNDFAKSLGVQNLAPESIASLVASGESAFIDVGCADGYHFLNSCGFGFDASVLEASNHVRFLRGDAVYIYSALAQLFTYRGIEIGVEGRNESLPPTVLMVTVSNGRSLGGRFQIAPHASVTDGELDVGFFTDCGVIGRVRLFVDALRGNHISLPTVRTLKTRSITLEFSAKPAMEMDGELRHATSRTVTIECLPRALSVVAAPGAL